MTVWGILVQAAALVIGAVVFGGVMHLFGAAVWVVASVAVVGGLLGWVAFWVIVIAAMAASG